MWGESRACWFPWDGYQLCKQASSGGEDESSYPAGRDMLTVSVVLKRGLGDRARVQIGAGVDFGGCVLSIIWMRSGG